MDYKGYEALQGSGQQTILGHWENRAPTIEEATTQFQYHVQTQILLEYV